MTHNKDASTAALEFAKHLITLSSGIVALSATFVSDFVDAPRWSLYILFLAWLCLAASVFGGLKTLSGIIQSRLLDTDDWSTGRRAGWAKLSRWSFLVGMALFAGFAAVVLLRGHPAHAAESTHAPEVASTHSGSARTTPGL
jgi:hypothetical protein